MSDNFVNDIGQELVPGDTVVIVTTGYSHHVRTRQGVYLGTKNGKVQCQVKVRETYYTDPEGKEVSWFEVWKKDQRYESHKREVNRITTLQRNRAYKIA